MRITNEHEYFERYTHTYCLYIALCILSIDLHISHLKYRDTWTHIALAYPRRHGAYALCLFFAPQKKWSQLFIKTEWFFQIIYLNGKITRKTNESSLMPTHQISKRLASQSLRTVCTQLLLSFMFTSLNFQKSIQCSTRLIVYLNL